MAALITMKHPRRDINDSSTGDALSTCTAQSIWQLPDMGECKKPSGRNEGERRAPPSAPWRDELLVMLVVGPLAVAMSFYLLIAL
ncbi:hypothetical protein [Shinella sp. G-2]|uniref:hypothetical protein n=1 Tax=Shinella sp. G-2 TaxID=3133141 RepID=UPI003CFC51F9